MHYVRMPIEIESPEQLGYDRVRYNLTESSLTDARLQDLWPVLGLEQTLRELVLCYSDHRGHPQLRALIAEQSSVALRETADGLQTSPAATALSPEDVLVTPGAALALFLISTTLLERGDHLIVVRPNYATNLETPRALGADISFVDLDFDQGWRLPVERVAAALRPNTRLVSLTTPHNPTGTLLPTADVERIAELVAAHRRSHGGRPGCCLLVDETYREMAFAAVPAVAATLGPHVISVSSMSKTYGLPGIRMGWLLCRDAELQERFLAGKEQTVITGSVVDEAIALRYLEHKAAHLPRIRQHIRSQLAIVKAWLAEPSTAALFECVEPEGGVVCFPRIRQPLPAAELDAFYRRLNEHYQTFVGPGHWFEQDRRYMRVGYGWPTAADLRTGLGTLTRALCDVRQS
jgi:aspartate/methionine/tyrosine aminotransferase